MRCVYNPDFWNSCLELIVSNEDKVLFAEAAASVKTNAYRGAYILLWLSCAEALKRKFAELSHRDGQAKKIIEETRRKESNHQSIDKYLLESAKKYGLLSESGHKKLEHVYIFRCIYGHPYEEQPTIENLQSAARDVVDLVLSQPVRLRYGYLEEQVHLLIDEVNFLDNTSTACAEYASVVYERSDPALNLWFLRKLWEKLHTIYPDISLRSIYLRGVWFSQEFLDRGIKQLVDNWDIHGDLVKYKNILPVVLADNRLFILLSDFHTDYIVSHFLELGQSKTYYLKALLDLVDQECLNERQRKRFHLAVQKIDVNHLIEANVPPNYYISRIISALKSHDWYKQSPAIQQFCNMGTNNIDKLPQETQILLGNNILQCAEGKEKSALGFLRELANDEYLRYSYGLIAGIFIECFVNDSDKIRFKNGTISYAIRIALKLPLEQRSKLITEVVERMKRGVIKYEYSFDGEKDKTLKLIESLEERYEGVEEFIAPIKILLASMKSDTSPDDNFE